jgi:hypothetical protein
MEPEVSLPYSQVSATYPYPEPTPSSPHHPFQLPEDHLNIILPSTPEEIKLGIKNIIGVSAPPLCTPKAKPMVAKTLQVIFG